MIITTYKGRSEFLEFVSIYEVQTPNKVGFTKSASNQRQTKLTVVSANNSANNTDELTRDYVNNGSEEIGKLKQYQIIKVETDKLIAWGIIMAVEFSSNSPNSAVLTIANGGDGIYDSIYIPDSSTQTNIFDTVINGYNEVNAELPRPITITGSGAGYILSPDKELPFNMCIRQLIKQGYREQITVVNNKLQFNYYLDEKTWAIRAEDLLSYKVNFSSTTYSKIVVRNKDNLALAPIFAYAYTNGQVGPYNNSLDIIDSETLSTKFELVSSDEFTQDYANKALKEQSYSNSIEFILRNESYIYQYIFESYLFNSLGTKITLYLDNDAVINTLIDEITLIEGKIIINFGVAQVRFADYLRERIRK